MRDSVQADPRWKTDHLDRFVRAHKSAADLLALKVYPNTKEITEAVAPWVHARTILGDVALGNDRIGAICVGDGSTPRAAAYLAFNTRWTCWSVDPALRASPRWSTIQRLRIFPGKVESFAPNLEPWAVTVIVAMHAHAPLDGLWNAIHGPKVCIACPCCRDLTAGMPKPADTFEDWAILSPARTIVTWHDGIEPAIWRRKPR